MKGLELRRFLRVRRGKCDSLILRGCLEGGAQLRPMGRIAEVGPARPAESTKRPEMGVERRIWGSEGLRSPSTQRDFATSRFRLPRRRFSVQCAPAHQLREASEEGVPEY